MTSSASPARSIPVPGKRVGATVNTMKVLEFICAHASGATTTEIAKATGINLSTCFNIARTLAAYGYLRWQADARRYSVGQALQSLAHELTIKVGDLASLKPAMQRIADRYELTVTLWKRHSLASMELLLATDSKAAVRIQMPVGQHLPVLFGGMGRIMALDGGLTDEERETLFASVHWGRPITYKTLMAQARLARRQGYGLDEGYTHRAVTAVAVAVPPIPGQPVAEICSATMFRDQHDQATMDALVADLHALARDAEGLKVT